MQLPTRVLAVHIFRILHQGLLLVLSLAGTISIHLKKHAIAILCARACVRKYCIIIRQVYMHAEFLSSTIIIINII